MDTKYFKFRLFVMLIMLIIVWFIPITSLFVEGMVIIIGIAVIVSICHFLICRDKLSFYSQNILGYVILGLFFLRISQITLVITPPPFLVFFAVIVIAICLPRINRKYAQSLFDEINAPSTKTGRLIFYTIILMGFLGVILLREKVKSSNPVIDSLGIIFVVIFGYSLMFVGIYVESFHLFYSETYPTGYYPMKKARKPKKELSWIENIRYNRALRAGNAAMEEGNREQGIRELTRAIRIYYFAIDAYFLRGEAYYQQSKWKQCVWDMNHVLDARPGDEQAFFYRADARLRMDEKLDQAWIDIQKAIALNPARQDFLHLKEDLLKRVDEKSSAPSAVDDLPDEKDNDEHNA
jgi:tetratricopeptide (TPR) repeat protein